MEILTAIEERLQSIEAEVMNLVADQQLALTEKNRRMKPLVEEKKLLERTRQELEVIRTTDYSGSCNPG